MSQTITIAKFRDVSEGLQPGQFAIGDREIVTSLDSLDPIYKELLDRPITITLGLIGPDGRVSLTPMWFDYEGDKVLINVAEHRKKTQWIRDNPQVSLLIMNPENMCVGDAMSSCIGQQTSLMHTVDGQLLIERCRAQ